MNDFGKNSPIDSKGAGRRNELMILTMLRKHKRLSQTELCRLAQIGSSTASTIVARLRDKGLIVETRGLSDRRGPKPTLLELNPQSLYVIGVEISPSYLYIGLFNFVGGMKDKDRVPLGQDHSPDHVIGLLGRHIAAMIDKNSLESEQVIGSGVTLSGSVAHDGSVSLSSPMGWTDVPLRERLSSLLGFSVLVYNNRVRLLAEFEIQPELASKNILYLNLANGVGSTLYVNGRMMSGATGRYGEIGHIVIDPNGPRCGCGNVGCLEAFISGPSLAGRIKRDFESGRAPVFAPIFAANAQPAPEEVVSLWADAARRGDAYSVSLRDETADRFSGVAALAINCYDPDIIILAGYIALLFPDVFADAIRQKMRTNVYDHLLRDIEITTARAGEDAVIKGLAAAVLQDSLSMAW
ncbi:MAG: ROK family transcriptional regulator [Planctomycetaceae bacterium]|nr:ROK family transcriptional regulator [Planctomycetaceae bacterium]